MYDYVLQIVKRRYSKSEIPAKAGMVALCVISFLLFLMLVGTSMGAFMLIVCALCIVGTVFVFRSYNLEFEYEWLSNELHIDKIIAQASRRKGNVFEFSKLERFELLRGNESRYDNVANNYKKYDYTSGLKDGDIYVATVYCKGELVQLFIEPNEEMLAAIKYFNPSKVFV